MAENQINFFEVESSHCVTYVSEGMQNIFVLEPPTNGLSSASDFISQINSRICRLQLNHDETNEVYQICLELLNRTQQLNETLMEKQSGLESVQALQLSTAIVREELLQGATRYKRDKQIAKN